MTFKKDVPYEEMFNRWTRSCICQGKEDYTKCPRCVEHQTEWMEERKKRLDAK